MAIELIWRAKTNARLEHESIQSMIRPETHVHIFSRTEDRAPFTYHGIGTASKTEPTTPVTIRWRFMDPIELGTGAEPTEISGAASFFEGAVKKVLVNKYERDPDARRACLAHWGTSCVVCGINFAARYGDFAGDYIHVHHLRLVAAAKGTEYQVDPIADLRPVCPNCHAMLHLGRAAEPLPIEELQRRLKERQVGIA